MAKLDLSEKNIATYMQKNKCSREEAIELIQYDCDVDDGKETEYDLTKEQKDFVKTLMRSTEHKSTKQGKHERKPNELKEAIIAELDEFLREDAQGQVYENVVVTNKNRQITFSVGEKRFEINLIEKRAPKT